MSRVGKQPVAIPAGATTLSFWYLPRCPGLIALGRQQAAIATPSGQLLAVVLDDCSDAGTWTRAAYDVSPFAGRTVVLWFDVLDLGWPFGPASMELDDVIVS